MKFSLLIPALLLMASLDMAATQGTLIDKREVQTLAAYVCMNPACNYGIPKTFFKREFSDEKVETLLKNKSTPILEPFKKNDTTFRAALELREGGKIAFNKLTVEVIEKKIRRPRLFQQI